MKIKLKDILIVDDEEKIVEVLKSYLESNNYCVYEAYNGEKALRLFDEIKPSLVILDLMLPDITGEELCRQIRKKSKTPIIMITARTEEESKIMGLNIGADDYITKPFSPREVLARISAVLRRVEEEDKLIEDVAKFHDEYLVIDYINYDVKVTGLSIDITPTEFKILTTLSKSPNKVYTREQLINQSLGMKFSGYDRTIDTYIKNIRQKIEVDSKKPQFILTVHGIGYKFGGE
jgi:DNA-binding response OmpR family regulator